MQQPSVGRMVHYVSHGTPPRPDGSQAFASRCRAATITEVAEHPDADGLVGLMVANPTGLFFHSVADGGAQYDEGDTLASGPTGLCGGLFRAGGTWHWPERV
jgi:hypothetical protein